MSAKLQQPVVGKPVIIGGRCFRVKDSPIQEDSKTVKIFLVVKTVRKLAAIYHCSLLMQFKMFTEFRGCSEMMSNKSGGCKSHINEVLINN